MYTKLLDKQTKLALIGLGYVGLPIAMEFAKHVSVIGFDINEDRLDKLRNGIDPCGELSSEVFEHKDITFTSSIEKLREASFYVIAVPTPIDSHNEPDLSPLLGATRTVGKVLKRGDYVVYESTVYPGCTEEDCIPILEEVSGLRVGEDFKVGYSPERINPGDKVHTLVNTVKIVSGCDAEALETISEVYKLVVQAGVHRAPSIKVAEAAKIIVNTQRDVNIALMNELSIIFDRMGVNTFDVLKAAGTKWNIGKKVVKKIISQGKNILGAHVLVMGMTFKENVSDIRNSKVADIINEFKDFGAEVDVMDPFASPLEVLQEYGIRLVERPGKKYDAVVVAVAHTTYLKLDESYFMSITNEHAVLADVKGVYRGSIHQMIYWSL